MVHLLESSRAALLALALVMLGFIVTLNRVPILWADDALYASVARNVQESGDGRPSVLRQVPGTPDHVTFYGPVFFTVAARFFDAFGFSLRTFRAVSLLGALVIVGAASALASRFGLASAARTWRAVILLLAPSVGAATTNGRMDTLAVGLAMAGFAVLVTGAAVPARRTPIRGAAASVLLLLSALTTPRSLPLVGTLFAGLAVLTAATRWDRPLLRMAVAAAGTFGAGILAWSILVHGEPLGWVQTLTAVVPRVGEEVAFVEGTVRDWQLAERPWTLVALVAGLPPTILAAWHLRAPRLDVPAALRQGALLAIGVAWVNLALALAVTNLTFVFAVYFTAPLLAVAVALPWEWFPIRRSTAARAICAVLLVCAAGRAVKYAAAAATWHARDPRGLRQFVRHHVPPGAEVIGRTRFYFFAVERSGAEMVSFSGESFASWTRFASKGPGFRIEAARGVPRFLLTRVRGAAPALPEGSSCAGARLVAEYQPPADTIPSLGWLARRLGDAGYPRTALWALPDDCVHEPGRIVETGTGHGTSRTGA